MVGLRSAVVGPGRAMPGLQRAGVGLCGGCLRSYGFGPCSGRVWSYGFGFGPLLAVRRCGGWGLGARGVSSLRVLDGPYSLPRW